MGGPADRQAPIFRQESEGGIRRRMRRQPGGESGWRCYLGMEPSVRAAGTHGTRLGGSHHGLRNGGCCEVGEPARVLFDAAARDDQHKYSGRSLRETGRGSSLAASGGPPPLEIPGRGDTPGFFLGAGATPFRGIPNPRQMAVGTAFCLRCGVDVSGGSTLVGLRAVKPPQPPSPTPE